MSAARTQCRVVLAGLMILAVFAVTAPVGAGIMETSNHLMAGGSFGVAWIDGTTLYGSNGYAAPQALVADLSGPTNRLVAGNVNGTGGDDVAYISGATAGLYYYDYATGSSTFAGGSYIADLAAGRWTAGDNYDTVVTAIPGSGNAPYTYNATTNTWTALTGDDVTHVTRGRFSTTNSDQFVAQISTGAGYVYTPGTGYSGQVGTGWATSVAGKLTNSESGDQIWALAATSAEVFYLTGVMGAATFHSTGGQAELAIAIGNLDGTGQKGYVIGQGSGGVIYQYSPSGGWSTLAGVTNNSGWKNMICEDVNGDGKDELFALNSTGQLYRLDYGSSAFVLVAPEPGTLALLATGLIGLVCYAWRKRR